MTLQHGPAWLFCPADRPERFAKAVAVADVVILDLEDGVAAADRETARKALVDNPLDPAQTVVRVNAADTADYDADLETLARTDYTTVMLPKSESAQQIRALAPLDVVVLVETPLGAVRVAESVQVDNAVAVMWGSEDLFAALGGTANRNADGTLRDVARGRRLCLPPRRFRGWRWIRCTSTSRISTDCARRSTTRSRSVSTPRSRFIPTRSP